ncbi:peptidoglycan DD-metalloendopeptidase family protein [Humidisolicoccus flavus]|uniref:peptidoglycan DD-metalloendopeptidase family protein n=1 Tax=Humidisolicoccus flavus TaxID=3111414 RepID=UPI00324D9E11
MTTQAHAASPQRRTSVFRLISLTAALAVGVSTAFVGGLPSAQAVDPFGFPEWSDVENARQNESAKNAEIKNIRSLLEQLETEVQSTQAIADQRALEAIDAQEKYDEAIYEADQLQQRADAATEKAKESERLASRLAAEIARTGGSGELSAELFANPGSADDWLYRLGQLDMAAGNADSVYASAQQDSNSASALQSQAAVARDELQILSDEAQAAFEQAETAAIAAQSALEKQQNNRAVLEAQLSVLVEDRAATEADYNAGVRWKEFMEAERLRKEEEARQARLEAERQWRAEQQRLADERERARQEQIRQQQEAAANNPGPAPAPAPAPSNPGGGIAAPNPPAASGWVVPQFGRITSGFGWRTDPLGRGTRLHGGLDIAAGCWAPVYASAAGTVSLVSRDAAGANFVSINHGGGIITDYYHLAARAIVNPGQTVSPGQVIGYEGMTGLATGCHVHFQVRYFGTRIDPLPFLRNQGVSI